MSDSYQPHLPQELVDETARRREAVRIRIIERERVRFWQRMLGDKTGREQFWLILEETGALSSEFKYAPNGAITMEATFAAWGKARYMWSIYRTLFAAATDLVVMMHRENDPAFLPDAPPPDPGSEEE